MDTLHTVLRAIRGEAKPRRDHLTVIREFLAHLERAPKQTTKAQKSLPKRSVKASKTSSRKAAKK